MQKLLYYLYCAFIFRFISFFFSSLLMLRVANEIQEFQVEILFEHFFFMAATCDGGVGVVVVVSGKLCTTTTKLS